MFLPAVYIPRKSKKTILAIESITVNVKFANINYTQKFILVNISSLKMVQPWYSPCRSWFHVEDQDQDQDRYDWYE